MIDSLHHFQGLFLHMDKLEQAKLLPWKAFELFLNLEESFQIHLLTYLVILQKQRVIQGKREFFYFLILRSTNIRKAYRYKTYEHIWKQLLFLCSLCFLRWCFIYRFLVRVSYLEIYNEEVRDLLGKDQTQRLEVRITEIEVLSEIVECLLNYGSFCPKVFLIFYLFFDLVVWSWFKI